MPADNAQDYWNRLADTYQEDVAYVVGSDLHDVILKRLGRESDLGRVAEFGCGTGLFTHTIADNAQEVVATDASARMVVVARRRLAGLSNVSVRQAPCPASGLDEAAYDTVLMANLIHMVPDPHAVLGEAWRVLRPGGRVLVISYTPRGMTLRAKLMMMWRYLRRIGLPPRHGRSVSPARLREWILEIGFRPLTVETVGETVKAVFVSALKPAPPSTGT